MHLRSRIAVFKQFHTWPVVVGGFLATENDGAPTARSTRAFPPYNYPMDSLINALFSIILVTDVRSPNPAIAAMKRARLWMIVCAIGEVVFLGLAFAMWPDEAATVSPVHVVQDLVSWLYFGGAVCCFVAFACNTWVWWRVRHIY